VLHHLVKPFIIDDNFTPSITKTATPTLTPSPTPGRCLTYSATSFNVCCFPISYIDCCGNVITNDYSIYSGATFCAKAGSIDNPYSGTGQVVIVELNDCSTTCITPTPTITPSITPTITLTPSITPTITNTPSQTPFNYSFVGYTGTTACLACSSGSSLITFYGYLSGSPSPNINEYLFLDSQLTQPVPDGTYIHTWLSPNPERWDFVNGGTVGQPGRITVSDPNGCEDCCGSIPCSPTPTITPTITPSRSA